MAQRRKISLEDKYALNTTRAYITGIQALVRLPILQHQRDLDAGLNTACFISGYRGSPLGSLDQELWRAQSYLDRHNIKFQPGVNEDLAATSVWGSQQVNLFPGAKYDGVFAMWYGKGPGVDRSMDAIKHANAFGTSKYGGVLAVAGDDHACKSSSLPHQSEHMFIGASIPVLNPANVQEVLDLGIFGWELSRFSGCWVALKAITENMDSAISAEIDPHRVRIEIPTDFNLPPEGLNARWPAAPLDQERILNKYRIYAARAFALANGLNRVVLDSAKPRFGIITSGKSYLDVMQALEDLGIDAKLAAQIGLRIFKLGMSWPLEPVATHAFAQGLEEILVVEEKRSIIEDQLTGQLYNWPVDERPRVVGEFDEQGRDLLPNLGELTPAMVARVIAARIARFYDSPSIRERLAFLQTKEQHLAQPRKLIERLPHYCSGCPHNTSTKVPQGSKALAGIGCHYMAQWMHRDTVTFTQMGGEGCTWIGQAPFTEVKHVFQNLGDGTYFHSGLLAIRAAIASGANITYKLLYNDAVAMTGGQPVDGMLSVAQIVYQLRGEGVQRIAVVSDDIDKYPADFPRFEGLSIDHRDALERIQLELRELPGTTVIIYDQTCAAEKRRRRKKGLLEDPPVRVFINTEVCEGCGDCSQVSNCLSILPVETELGRKRVIDQDSCNKDYSCLKGFCPSFVTLTGGELKRASVNLPHDGMIDRLFTNLPDPVQPSLAKPWNVLVAGVGGTGVLTVGSVLAMAAHIEGKGCSTLNQTGLAQKFGAVISHVRIAADQSEINAVRIPAGDADLLLGCDLVVTASDEALAKLHIQRSHVVVNDYEMTTSGFILNPDFEFPASAMKQSLCEEAGQEKVHSINATLFAKKLLGDAIGSNLFLLGYAYQKGLIPISEEALMQAIELNAVAIDFNKQAFVWGRRAAFDPVKLAQLAKLDKAPALLTDLDEIIQWRVNYLTDYQDGQYARSYADYVASVRRLDTQLEIVNRKGLPLTQAVAKGLFKLMAYKDEYEVARLYSDGRFKRQIEQQFSGDYKLKFHLAAPLLSRRDKQSGQLLKRSYPQWISIAFPLLAKLKFLRGTAWDIFGYSNERRHERALIKGYRGLMDKIMPDVTAHNYDTAIALAELPQSIRGYGHIKERNITKARQQEKILLDKFYQRDDLVVRLVVNE